VSEYYPFQPQDVESGFN